MLSSQDSHLKGMEVSMKSVPHSSQNTVEFTASLPISQHSPYPHSSSPEPPLEEERLTPSEEEKKKCLFLILPFV
jgi:hypothetical protein